MTNNAWAYLHSDAGRVVMDTKVQWRYELQSDWVKLEDQIFLAGLIESPEVYYDDGGNFTSVVVISPTVAELKLAAFGDIELNSIKVIIETSMDYWRQRG